MARLPRLTLPQYPHHVIQRGNNRQVVFTDAEDFEKFLALLAEHSVKNQVQVHAYVAMPNHFHLLVTPAAEEGLPKMMQSVGRAYAQYFNKRHQRTGTLWEGRYRATVLEAQTYLLPCMAFIDSNPVRSGMAAQAADYPWSSAAHWLGLRHDRMLSPHAAYWALGNTPFAREAAYVSMLQEGQSQQVERLLVDAALSGWALGSPEFVQSLQQQTPRRITKSKPGRPRKTPVEN